LDEEVRIEYESNLTDRAIENSCDESCDVNESVIYNMNTSRALVSSKYTNNNNTSRPLARNTKNY